MGYVNGQEIEMGIRFRNQEIVKIPPQRVLRYLNYRGFSKGKPFHVHLTSAPMKEIRECFGARKIDLPPVVGNWDTMNIWINNMWEALYNPVKLLKHRERKWAIMDGCHRLRLLDAMDADLVWFYEYKYEYARNDWRVPNSSLPRIILTIMERNNKPPRHGTYSGTCKNCGKSVKWSRPGMGKLIKDIQYCSVCGAENPYPYPGRL